MAINKTNLALLSIFIFVVMLPVSLLFGTFGLGFFIIAAVLFIANILLSDKDEQREEKAQTYIYPKQESRSTLSKLRNDCEIAQETERQYASTPEFKQQPQPLPKENNDSKTKPCSPGLESLKQPVQNLRETPNTTKPINSALPRLPRKPDLQPLIRKCCAITKAGNSCGLLAIKGSDYCQVHGPVSEAPYKEINLAQGSDEWLEWRKSGIGASEASSILGENQFKNRNALLKEKLGLSPEFKGNDATRRGQALEPQARAKYIDLSGVHVEPVCLQSNKYSWLKASLDGLSSDGKTVVEIKCGESSFRDAQQGIVSSYYKAQLQHIMAITGLSEIDYFCFNPGHAPVLISVDRDEGYIRRLLQEEEKFWEDVQKGPGAFREDTTYASRSVCPRCGGQLTSRKGKYGPFLGCVNFPRCKHTQNV